jgi:hypothetical protein
MLNGVAVSIGVATAGTAMTRKTERKSTKDPRKPY